MQAKWLEVAVAKIQAILKGGSGSETEKATRAIAELRAQQAADAAEEEAADRRLLETMASAVEGDAGIGEIESCRREVNRIRGRREDRARMMSVLEGRLGRARQNATAKELRELRAAFNGDVDEITRAIGEISVCDERKAAAHKRAAAASLRARQKAERLGIAHFPELWKASAIVHASELDLVRLAPEHFRYYPYSLAFVKPTLEQQHRAAVAAVIPPSPAPQPVAA
jgi:hypothetical protein